MKEAVKKAQIRKEITMKTIVPGHGSLISAAIFSRYLRYLSELIESVRKAIRAGKTLEETLSSTPLGEQYAPPPDSPLGRRSPVLAGFHRWNVQKTYQELNGR